MEELVREELTKVSNKKDIFTTIMFFAFVIAAGLIICSTISMKNKVNNEMVGSSISCQKKLKDGSEFVLAAHQIVKNLYVQLNQF